MRQLIKQVWRYAPARWALLIGGVTVVALFFLPGVRMGGLSADGFLPHATCYLQDPRIIWLHVISDSFIGLAYLTISGTLGYIVYRARHDIPFHWMFVAFGLFIVTCGLTHLMAVITVWHPVYWLSGDVKAVTAVASVATAIVLPATVPRIFNLIHTAKVSEQRKRDLEVAHEKLKESEELKSQFFANVSHELRTPLSLILGPVRRRLEAESLPPEEKAELEVIERNAGLLLQQVNNLLDLAKLEAGSMRPSYAAVDLAAIVRRIASYFEGLVHERGIAYQVATPETLPAEVDIDKAQRVFLNLFSNAFKFTPEHGAIHVSLEAVAGEARFVIEDSGPGIPEHLREAAFERFRQVEGGATRKVGGTGLGLPIALEFVHLHGGRMDVGQATLGGAKFEVHLPLRAPEGAAVAQGEDLLDAEQGQQTVAELKIYRPQPTSTDEPSSSEHDNRPLVLVVEDHPDMNHFITSTLRSRYRVVSGFNGREGLEKARRLQPDLIVTDIMMPEMSGDQMIAHLQDDAQLSEIPLLVLTAKADERQRVQLLEHSVQDHLTKPFQPQELLARAGGIIDRRRKTIRQLRMLNASLEQRVAERTAQAQAQAEQLRLLAVELNTTEQRERRQLAKAVHDHLQQLLVNVRLGIERAVRRANSEVAKILMQVELTLDQAIQAAHNLTVELYPPVLYDRGLAAALQWLGDHVRQQHGLNVDVHVEEAANPADQELQAFLFAAVQELLLNVVKHAKTNDATVTMQREASNVLIIVEDQGVGCTSDRILHSSDTGGFGLFNIRERLRVLGGLMKARTMPSQGCRVELECPLEISDQAGLAPWRWSTHGPQTQADVEALSPQAQSRPIRVMIVDDHKMMREGLSGILGDEEDIQVVAEAADGREAIERVDEVAPDVIVMDVSMPRMDGVETTRWLTKERPHIRIVGLSMHNNDQLAQAMIDAGALTYLTKGGPSSDLVDAIRGAGAAS